MSPTRTLVLVAVLCTAAVAAIAVTVHLRWLPWDGALWIAMGAVFLSWRAVQPALHARADERRQRR